MSLIDTAILFSVAAVLYTLVYALKRDDYKEVFLFSGGVVVGVWGLLLFNWIFS